MRGDALAGVELDIGKESLVALDKAPFEERGGEAHEVWPGGPTT
jgi:hypothetical protein